MKPGLNKEFCGIAWLLCHLISSPIFVSSAATRVRRLQSKKRTQPPADSACKKTSFHQVTTKPGRSGHFDSGPRQTLRRYCAPFAYLSQYFLNKTKQIFHKLNDNFLVKSPGGRRSPRSEAPQSHSTRECFTTFRLAFQSPFPQGDVATRTSSRGSRPQEVRLCGELVSQCGDARVPTAGSSHDRCRGTCRPRRGERGRFRHLGDLPEAEMK
jgi:hypothetical protein